MVRNADRLLFCLVQFIKCCLCSGFRNFKSNKKFRTKFGIMFIIAGSVLLSITTLHLTINALTKERLLNKPPVSGGVEVRQDP
jgi:hypothetical protein